MHPLDNVIWQALTTRQSHFAESCDGARRFFSKVSPLGAFEKENAQGYESLGKLLTPGETVGLFLDDAYDAQPGWKFVAGAPLWQMVREDGVSALASDGVVETIELGPKDSPEMIELTALTKPGPFDTRTHEFGTYLGIGLEGKLIAMAGERLKVPGHTEVSAVCTHPEYSGRGYAACLMSKVMQLIARRGETPFLHVREDNVRAIELYRRLGFRLRVRRHFAVLRKE